MPGHIVEISNRQTLLDFTPHRFIQAVTTVLRGENIHTAEINIAVVDNAQIHETNRQFLQHDYATDVITFPWDEPEGPLQGDIMVSAEMAEQVAAEHGWSALDELVLYVIHGTLHLAGYDDHSDEDRAGMRERESHYLAAIGIIRSKDSTLSEQSGGDS